MLRVLAILKNILWLYGKAEISSKQYYYISNANGNAPFFLYSSETEISEETKNALKEHVANFRKKNEHNERRKEEINQRLRFHFTA